MRRKLGWLVMIVLAFGLGHASAQGTIPDGAFVRDSADNTWLVSGGTKSIVPIYPAGDDDIQPLPESGRWVVADSGGLVRLGDRPEWGEDPAPIHQKDNPPKVTIALSDSEVERGGSVQVTIFAADDFGLEWIEWEGEAGDRGTPEDPALALERRFDCGGQTQCTNTWTVTPKGVGSYVIVARARDLTGQRSDATADLMIK